MTNSTASFPAAQNGATSPEAKGIATEPDARPGERFLEFDGVGVAMKNAEIERQKNQHARDETRPVPRRDFNQGKHGGHQAISLYRPLAPAAFSTATCTPPMFGRWPLCHQRTSALAM